MSRVETRRRHEASVDDDIALLDELRRLGSACSKCRRRRNSCCGCARRRTTPWCGRRRFSTACSRPAYRVEAGRRQSMKASPAIVVRVQQALRAQGHVVPGLRPEQLVRRPISGGVGPARGTKRFVHRARRRRSRQRQHHKSEPIDCQSQPNAIAMPSIPDVVAAANHAGQLWPAMAAFGIARCAILNAGRTDPLA